MVYGIFIVLHVLVAALLIAVVLMQTGRGGGLAGAFGGGGGGGQTLFGGRGATTFLTKMTWILGAAFMVTSFVLALTVSRQTGAPEERSIVRENPIQNPAGSLPLEPVESGAPGAGTPSTTIPLGEDTPGAIGDRPAATPDGETVPSGEDAPVGTDGEVPSSDGS